MVNPSEALLEWFNLINEDHQEEIAVQYLKEFDQVLDSLGNIFTAGISYDKGNIPKESST